eukprot:TRINITY_DN4437_c0_g1_i1.p1 TRINITY_DN4437_c0_g1~~TRINITY_DN4437_c0_g1_i1.p1  ORF type:complete len:108 (+),score=15.68 TRINITY_DN4437_c0_g1_i1:454-777(+)
MKAFYRNHVVLNESQDYINQLTSSGMCIRINDPSNIIKNKYPSKGITRDDWNPTTLPTTLIQSPNSPKEAVSVEQPKTNNSDSTLNTLSLEKMWIISSLVKKHLSDN